MLPISASRRLHFALALGLALGAPALLPAGCSDGDSTEASASGGSGDECVGGRIVDGQCVASCESEKCLAENVCVDNACLLTCDSHVDCNVDGTQNCAPGTRSDLDASDPAAAVQVCQSNGKASGFGLKCPFGAECADPAVYNAYACPDGSDCDPSQCGGQPGACVDGACPDGSACVVATCPENECKAMKCLTAGEADAEAYCSSLDCSADTDCPGGYYCAAAAAAEKICGEDPPKGPGAGEDCVDRSAFATDGATYQEGPIGTLRNVCKKRGPCAPCETDLDCSLGEGLKCATLAMGGKACGAICGQDKDCERNYECDDAQGVCVPRFGACKGTGKFCEPCENDLDCGDGSGTVYCADLSGNERGCFDSAFPDTCSTDSDCPTSPSGTHGTCLNQDWGVPPGDQLYERCYLPIGDFTTCW
jgi:hypothetical protein